MAMTGDTGEAGERDARDDGGESGDSGERGERGDSHESRVVLVDDLAAADDYWLTITDAARVTRRQEITIRRWIAAGALPVRRQRMGLNKRTRQVRASDLARLTPIIDPTAAITGAPAQADLLSIPVQQAQLLATQQALVQRLTQYEQTLADLSAQHNADRQVLAQQEAQQAAQLQAAVDATAALRQDVLDVQVGMQALREATEMELEEFRQATTALTSQVQSLVQRVDAALYDTADQLTHERAARARGHDELVAGLTAQTVALHQLDVVAQQVQTQQAQQATQQAQAEQERRTWQQQLAETRELLVAQQQMASALSHELTTVRQAQQEAQQDWQRQFKAQQDRAAAAHADLLAHLQVERHRRRVLEQRVQSHAVRLWHRQRARPRNALSHADDATETS